MKLADSNDKIIAKNTNDDLLFVLNIFLILFIFKRGILRIIGMNKPEFKKP